ncbi:hypothetical protein CRG98_018185 [Punica granatum]|uniref:Uncharacterized protein n=1 Tax=Punica granatum TaxID=22663 RepID=A0A2I0JYL8_PUNGR|nr:hypothetical protein CRG98_018185 [Punica granatum]
MLTSYPVQPQITDCSVLHYREERIGPENRRLYLPCPRSKLGVVEKVPATSLRPGEGEWKLRQASLSEEAGGPWGIEARRSRWMEDFVEDSKLRLEGREKLGLTDQKERRKGKREKGKKKGGLLALGFGPLLGPGLGQLETECRIAESVRFCNSTVQRAIQPRLHYPDSPRRIGIEEPP